MKIHITKQGPTLREILLESFRDTASLCTIPSVEVTCDPGMEHERDEIESGLASMLLAIGNSSGDNVHGMMNALQNHHACDPKQDSLIGAAKGAEVICLASGPSASERFEWVRNRQFHGAIVVCADSIFRGAVAAGIDPDFVCVLERDERMAEMVPPYLCPDAILVCPPVVHPLVAEGWGGRRVWVWQASSFLYDLIGPSVPRVGTGRSAGTLAVLVSMLLDPARIVLVGHDLCEIDGESHANRSETLSKELHQVDLANPGNTYHRRRWMTCNDGEWRPSTLFWEGCRRDIESMLASRPCPVHQTSMKGAEIAGAVVIPPPETPCTTVLRLRPTTPSRYSHYLRGEIEEDLRWHLDDLKGKKEPAMPSQADIDELIPGPAASMAVLHVVCLDLLACSLRTHLDAASGLGKVETCRRAWRLLHRRMCSSLQYAINCLGKK